jgi:hypothetical protein
MGIADKLREIAYDIDSGVTTEAGSIAAILQAVFKEGAVVTRHEFTMPHQGNPNVAMITDQVYVGSSVVIHHGAANDAMLADRLIEKHRGGSTLFVKPKN